jgi:hypothetical protein
LLYYCSVRLCVWCVYPRDCAPFGRRLAHFVRWFVAHFIRFVVVLDLDRSRFLTALRAFFSFFCAHCVRQMVLVARLRSLLFARFARFYRRPRRLGLALVSRFARLLLAALAGFSFARLTAHSQPPDLRGGGDPLRTTPPIHQARRALAFRMA